MRRTSSVQSFSAGRSDLHAAAGSYLYTIQGQGQNPVWVGLWQTCWGDCAIVLDFFFWAWGWMGRRGRTRGLPQSRLRKEVCCDFIFTFIHLKQQLLQNQVFIFIWQFSSEIKFSGSCLVEKRHNHLVDEFKLFFQLLIEL